MTPDKPKRSTSQRYRDKIGKQYAEIAALEDLVSELLDHLAAGSAAQRATAERIRQALDFTTETALPSSRSLPSGQDHSLAAH